jgi:gamma-glutamylcyclotransferase (GGCT)/AIG2-like uncharacterized protein YtfP
MNLFAYGTLMWPEILADVIGRSIEGVPAKLPDARRLRVKNQVYPSLVLAQSGAVDGILYFDLTEPEIAALDRFEGDEYVRRRAEVLCGERTELAEVYFTSEAGLALLEPDEWHSGHLSDQRVQSFRDTYKGWR